ncbi:DUF7878 domain-containing protein [Actinoallomurus soli]|uniref:DUF7878 domain-containing protein n=1 Tax=Actinoallomurus soli TaxID=2952535 RepID=UPI002093CE77|nr:hypothetical protein [Actinoallomurus soli]MCO5969605.1 hypothetical protein [Actinoallomurus soli]
MGFVHGEPLVSFSCQDLCAPDLRRRGLTVESAPPAVLLVDIEADLVLIDGDRIVWSEERFPVAELARQLMQWLQTADGSDFEFDSMSYAETGAVCVVRSDGGWRVGSVFEPPKLWTSPLPWEALAAMVRAFVGEVCMSVLAIGIEPGFIAAP